MGMTNPRPRTVWARISVVRPSGMAMQAEKSEEADGENGFRDDEVAIKEGEEFADPSSLGSIEDEKDAHAVRLMSVEQKATMRELTKAFQRWVAVEELMIPFQGEPFPRRGERLRY